MLHIRRTLRSLVLLVSALALQTGLVRAQAQILPKTPLTNALTQQSTPPVAASAVESFLSSAQSHDAKAAGIDSYQTDMEKRRDSAKASLVKIQNEIKQLDSNDSAQRSIAQERLDYLQKQFDGYSQSVDTLKDLRRLNDKLAITQKELETWVPPAGTPPWKLSVADDLRFAIMQLQFQVHHLDQRMTILDQEIDDRKKARAKYEVELRQANDKNELSSTPGTVSHQQVVDSAKRRLAEINQQLSNNLLDKDVVSMDRTISSLKLTILNKNWAYYDNRFVYSDEDLEKTKLEIDNKLTALRKQEQQASLRVNRTLEQAATARTKLDQLQRTPDTPAETLNQAKQEWRMADSLAQAARIEREKYRALSELNAILLQMWTLRHTIYSATDSHLNFSEIKSTQVALMRRLDQGLQYLTQIIAEKSQSFFELGEQLKASKDATERSFIKNLMKPVDEEIDNTREVYAEVGRVRQLLQISDEEIKSKESRLSFTQILQTVQITTWGIGKSIWNYEIFAIDDTMIVDGREVKIKRSVTIGKSIGALTILIVGFMVITRLIRRTLALAVTKGNLGASKSVILGRWLVFIAGITLIITAFNLVEIPLSAFAFFGGALAIGVGFGTQNILKNLISGVMLLIEKPIRIGDLVEIDGVTGTVTSIGIRFSTIHGSQGTDTLIPNSSLVEHKLINWTYTTPDVRKDIKLTVGYNSNPQQVQEILLAISNAHPQVIRTPSPLVTLDDFGDNGLTFNLQCWLRLETGLNVNQVLSDLRLKILEAFTEAAIEFPFPQRMMQFDKTASIEVRMAPEPK